MNEQMEEHGIGHIVAEVVHAQQDAVHGGTENGRAGEEAETDPRLADLERRIRELEAALGDLRSVQAAAAPAGRKTVATYRPQMLAKGEEPLRHGGVDDALGSLSVEQRFAVKAGLLRAGLL